MDKLINIVIKVYTFKKLQKQFNNLTKCQLIRSINSVFGGLNWDENKS